MRLFEALLLLVNLPTVLWLLLFPLRRPRWPGLLPLLGLLIAVIHLVWEGYRWQMVPAYFLTAVLLIRALYRLQKSEGNRGASRAIRMRSGAGAGLIILLVAAALPLLLPVPNLPPATGSYPVGTTTFYLVDDSREESLTPDPADVRELMVQVWYPAAPVGDEKAAVFLESLDVAGPVLAREFDLPPFLLNHINLVDLHILQDAPVAAGGTYPIIIFSHGLTGIRVQNTSMVRELASHGYVVAAIDHTYANALTVFPDGRVILYDPCLVFASCDSNYREARGLVQTWADDMAFVLDLMAGWQEEAGHLFQNRLNLEQVGVFGHSTGGGATLQFCWQDPRCDAGLGLDAWVLPVAEAFLNTPPEQPFMFISTPSWLGDLNRRRGQEILTTLPGDSYRLTLAKTQHYDFSDLVLISPLSSRLDISGDINSRYSLRIQTEYVLAFFDRYLQMRDTPLLTQPAPYPELTITYQK